MEVRPADFFFDGAYPQLSTEFSCLARYRPIMLVVMLTSATFVA